MTHLRASSADIAANCTGAPALLARTTIVRDDLAGGQLKHAWLAHKLCGALLPDEPEPDGIPWTWIEEVAERYGLVWERGQAEVTMPSPELGGCDLTGTVDYLQYDTHRIVVLDWKAGLGQRWILPPMPEWLQGLVYALLAKMQTPEALPVLLLRGRIDDREADELLLKPSVMPAVLAGIEELCESVAAAPEMRKPGPHCEHCLAREHCPEWCDQVEDVRALIVRPGASLTTEQLARWAIARGSVSAAVEVMDRMLRDAVRAGEVIEHDGHKLCLVATTRERVVDVDAVRMTVGPEATEVKVTSSKTLIEKVLKERGMKPKERAEVVKLLREAGAFRTDEVDGRLVWK